MKNGAQAKVLEQFVVDAMSFTEAEATTTKDTAYGTITDIVTIKRSLGAELIKMEAKRSGLKQQNYITLDEKTDKEKKPILLFVNAETITDAKKAVDDFLKIMIDYKVLPLDEPR